VHQTPTATDLVDRKFSRAEPIKLWVTDITEHPDARGQGLLRGRAGCLLSAVVGWSIDSSQTSTLVTNAVSIAIGDRKPAVGAAIHSDHGVHFTSWAFTRRAMEPGLIASMGSIGDCYDNAESSPLCSIGSTPGTTGHIRVSAKPGAVRSPPVGDVTSTMTGLGCGCRAVTDRGLG
jgi:transposase InsO family protein